MIVLDRSETFEDMAFQVVGFDLFVGFFSKDVRIYKELQLRVLQALQDCVFAGRLSNRFSIGCERLVHEGPTWLWSFI